MSWLTLVRHAQASFHADHYDQLSPLGEKQACRLGEAWARQKWMPDEVYVGPRFRQQQTADTVAACYERSGLHFPTPIVLKELDEYDLTGILGQFAPLLAKENNEFAQLFDCHSDGATNRERERSFQKMFEPLMRFWQTMQHTCDGLESWLAFGERVARGLKRMMQQTARSRRVAAFTSGGFIGTAIQQVLAAPDATALEINWRIRNCAVTEFVFSGERITLDSFNSVAHLTEPELLTYR